MMIDAEACSTGQVLESACQNFVVGIRDFGERSGAPTLLNMSLWCKH